MFRQPRGVCEPLAERASRVHQTSWRGHQLLDARRNGVVDELRAVNLGIDLHDSSNSACVPLATIVPLSSTMIWSALRTVLMRWAMTNDVRPRISRSSACWISYSVATSTLLV